MGRIRLARVNDLPRLHDIEQDADARFASIGMAFVVDCPPATPEALADALADGRLAVAIVDADVPVGFALVEELDGRVHVEQISVHPDAAGHGLGAALLTWAENWGRARGHREASLRTYADVPWNAPWYERRGWAVLPDAEASEGLRALIAHEGALGLDAAPRVVMVRTL